MSFYRIKQFYWAINSKLNNKDMEFLKKNLSTQELNLFLNLSVHEQKHCINVAYDVERVCKSQNINSKALLKASLLHDIGKCVKKLTIIDKSIIVILDKLSKGRLKRLSKFQKLYVYYNHSEISYEILKRYNCDYRILYLVKNHHNDEIKEDVELNILKMCDDRN
ncbi:HDIG domain-containing protein [Clostridium sp. P21]|uniref:HDIG domain-containing protein n=1 Tax=Clostridium muellerianum TaxID=2716538 RepID=A0A7Y0EIP6_9CLOT|nr:HDIG domain-containing metalloprotein [Clostridium muellerianum]NMM64132.1 HDIG domain-containing protein [Clostridium muellerianum]